MKPQFCRLVVHKGKIIAEDFIGKAEDTPVPVENLIKTDKAFGYMMPNAKGETTWSLLNTDTELSFNAAKASIEKGLIAWTIKTGEKFKFVKDFNVADIQIMFRSQAEDKNLTGSTIAYAYYPFTKMRLMVFNIAFLFTQHGNAMKGKDVELLGVKVQFPNGMYETIDLDKVVRHELGHKKFGLQHDPEYWQTMSGKEPVMSENIEPRDIQRALAKSIVNKPFEGKKKRRMEEWHESASERKF